MDMHIRQSLQMKQQLVMTPKLQQALRLLQIPALKLAQELKQEIMMNPLLEEELAETTETVDEEAERNTEDEMERWEDYFESHFQDSLDDSSYRGAKERLEEFNRVQPDVPTLRDHLLEQLVLCPISTLERDIGEHIIHDLDDDGFLLYDVEDTDVDAEIIASDLGLLGLDTPSEDAEEIAEEVPGPEPPTLGRRGYALDSLDDIAKEFSVTIEVVEDVLCGVIQKLDPPGMGARDLRETLMIQLELAGLDETPAWHIARDHLEDLQQHRFPAIAQSLDVSMDEVRKAVAVFHALEPRPGQEFSTEGAKAVIPDLIVDRVEDEYIISLNDKGIPRLRVSPSYRHLIRKDSGASKKTREYVLERLNSANWLIKAIEQRRQTMMKVMTHIVKVQRPFLDHGISHMKPLTLLDVADAIGMHESTVSRVTNGKYVQTPRGVFELKYFFGSAISGSNGEDVASKAVKDKILELIRHENPDKPYSDQAIVGKLEEAGLKIARRTVAKYRDQLEILPARMRKRV